MARSERVEKLIALDPARRQAEFRKLSRSQQVRLEKYWPRWAHEGQLPPDGAWHTWVIMAGRGYGKTRAGAEWVRGIAESDPTARIALVGDSLGEARRVMVEGPSGLLAIARPKWRPAFEPSKRQLTWPYGAVATLYSAGEPESLRGPQHSHAARARRANRWRHRRRGRPGSSPAARAASGREKTASSHRASQAIG